MVLEFLDLGSVKAMPGQENKGTQRKIIGVGLSLESHQSWIVIGKSIELGHHWKVIGFEKLQDL